MRLEHWTSAAEQGALAAVHALGLAEPRPLASVPYFWSDWYDRRIQFVGTPRADAVVVARPADEGFVALYRRGARLVGALTVDAPREVVKLRRRIADRGALEEALAFVRGEVAAAR